MKKILSALTIATALTACSTKTLLTFNLDGASFVSSRSGNATVPVSGTWDCVFPDDNGNSLGCDDIDGSLLSLPALSFLTSVKLNVNISLGTSATASLELFIAPENATNIYQPQYRVFSGSATTSTSFVASTDLSASSSDAAQQQAFSAIKSGKFRYGAHFQGSATAGSTLQYTLNQLNIAVSGYPIKVFYP